MPTASDLVTDLPADFETFGQAVATSMADLLGGTTNQVLAKNSNADMDFKWVTDATGMTNPMTTTGDTIYSSSGSTPARLGIGSTGQVLTVAAGVPSWATPAGGKVLQVVAGYTSTEVVTATSTFVDTNLTATITPTAATSKVLVFVTQQCTKSGGTADTRMGLRLLRGATTVQTFFADQGVGAQSGTSTSVLLRGISLNTAFLDNPATTSATTYKTQFNSPNTGNVNVQFQDNQTSSIILMEIGA
jgi:hypothetical protein